MPKKRETTSQRLVELTKKNLSEKGLKRAFVNMLLDSSKSEISEMLPICAIPHWFDKKIVERIIDIDESKIDSIIYTISELSFTWPSAKSGYSFHEDVRDELLQWWNRSDKRKLRFREISKKLHMFFISLEPSASNDYDEAIYHWFAFDKSEAFNCFLVEFAKSLKNWDISRAEHLLRLVEEKKNILDDDQLYRLTYYNAELKFQVGDWNGADPILRGLVNKKIEHKLRGLILNKYGLVLDFRREWNKAEKYFEKALEIGEQTNDYVLVGEVYHNIGIIYRRQEKWEKAINFLNKSLEIRKKVDDKWGVAQCNNNLGRIYRKLEDWEKALQYFNYSLEIRKDIGDVGGIAQCINNIGVVLNEIGEWERSLDTLYKALEIRQSIGDIVGSNVTKGNIAAALENLGKYEDAIILLQEVVEQDKQLNYFDLEYDTHNLNRLLQKVYSKSDQDISKKDSPYSPS